MTEIALSGFNEHIYIHPLPEHVLTDTTRRNTSPVHFKAGIYVDYRFRRWIAGSKKGL